MTRKYNQGGLAPYGLRHSGEGVKGKGYFGPMAGRDGTVTELSAEDESGEFPLVVPTLTAEELDRLLAGGEPTPEMLDKASSWAATRRKRGESPFASPTEVRMPRPKAEGGSVSLTDLPDEVNPSNWREHLQNNVLADARALLGAKDGGVINLDELIEKSLKKKDGGVINLDELIAWTMAKDEHRKMKAGGAVKMADGGQTFPLQRPEEVTDLKPRPKTKRDELLEMLSKGVGSVHEFVSKPFGYENPPGEMVSSLIGLPGTAKTLERMAYGDPLTSGAGMTTNLLPETTEAAMLALGAAPTVLKATKNLPVGLSIKPTDMLDMELANKMKAEKIKAPANPVGFYNPAEKAALNLQRKKGPGSAFISDLKKQPGVTDERIAELGLTDLASNPNVTREDVIAAVEQNRIPLRESVRRPYDEAAEYSDTISGIEDSLIYYRGGVKDVQAELERVRKMAPNSPLVKQYEDKLAVMRDKVDELEAKLDSTKPAKFGPDVDESYSLPGGEDYREIRVRLPSNKRPMSYEDWRKSGSSEEWSSKGMVGEDFMHQVHHDNEPNVLFHLRVANHVDEEGKRGLLIDELQSDWHQAGREKGYGDKLRFGYSIVEQEPGFFLLKKEGMSMPMASGTKEEIMDRARHYNAIEKGVPDAPFKDNWYQLGLKRAIKEAVDTGMDRVYLTTGARQADRYDLSKQLSRVSYQDGVLHGYDNSGALVVNKAMTPDELPNYVGKDLGKKMVENAQKDAEIRNKISVARYEGRPESEINALRSQLDGVKTDYAGVDLKVGGEGMKQYYDKNYKNYLEKYAKQHGGKLGMTRLEIGGEQNNWPAFRDWFAAKYPPGSARGGSGTALYQWEEGANNKFVKEFIKGLEKNYEPVYYIDLTDAMRESAKKGQSYADGGGVFNTDPDITDSGRIIPEHNI